MKPLESKLLWATSGKSGELSSSGNLDYRMVLSKSKQGSNTSQSHRRVLLPEGKMQCESTRATESTKKLPCSDLIVSEQTSSKQACKEELEFLKIKLRYMQNDIEFKRNQIESSKISHQRESATSHKWNSSSPHYSIQGDSVHNSITTSSSNSKQHPRPSITKWMASVEDLQQYNTKTNKYDKTFLQHRNNLVLAKKNSQTFSGVTENNTTAVGSYAPFLNCSTRLGNLRPDNMKTEYPRLDSVLSVPMCPVNSYYTSTIPTQKQNIPLNQTVSIPAIRLAHPLGSYGSMTQIPLSNASAIRSDGFYESTQKLLSSPHKTIHFGSNNSTQTPLSGFHTTGNVGTNESSTQKPLSGHSTTRTVSSYKIVTQIPFSNASTALSIKSSAIKKTVSAFERLGQHRLEETQIPISSSPDKRQVLCPSKTSSPSIASSVSDQEVVGSSFNSNPYTYKPTAPGSASCNFHLPDTDSKNTTTAVSVNRFKLIKQSAIQSSGSTNAQKVPSYNTTVSITTSNDSSILWNLLSLTKPIKTATRKGSHVNRLSLRSPNSKLQTAAKVVTKYKVKKLSPTPTLSVAPLSFCGREHFKTPLLPQKAGLDTHFNDYSKNLLKLDRRQVFNDLVPYKSSIKKFTDIRNSSLNRAHKIDRGKISNQPKNSSTPHQTLSRSKLKIDKRIKTKNVSLNKFNYCGVINVHKLDRRSLHPVNLKLQSNKGGKHFCIGGQPFSPGTRRNTTRTRKSNSEYSWKKGITPQSKVLQVTSALNSKFKWSRPNLQAQNGAWQHLRQKLQLLLNKKYRHSRYKFTKHPYLIVTPSTYRKASKAGDYKTNLVTIDGIMYKSSSRKLTRTRRLSGGSSRKRATSELGISTALVPKTMSVAHAGVRKSGASFTDLNGLYYANRAIHRSIAITTARYKKNNQKSKTKIQHCIFFGRFGRCHRGDKCPYVHDPEKVAVCTKFLRGQCDAEDCPFSHKASMNKIPVCLFYLRGSCFRETCPYLHVRVNPDAPVCKDFRNGFCSLGEKCKKIHSHVCPSFAMTGSCSRAGTCMMLHRSSRREHDMLHTQTEPLMKKRRFQRQMDQKRFVPDSNSSDLSSSSGTSNYALSCANSLAIQPSFISLESSPAPSFISLKTSQPKEDGMESKWNLNEDHSGFGRDNLSEPTGQNNTKGNALSIRPSFLASKFYTKSQNK